MRQWKDLNSVRPSVITVTLWVMHKLQMAKFGSPIGLYSVNAPNSISAGLFPRPCCGSLQLSPRSSVWISGVLLLREGWEGEWGGEKGKKRWGGEEGEKGRDWDPLPLPQWCRWSLTHSLKFNGICSIYRNCSFTVCHIHIKMWTRCLVLKPNYVVRLGFKEILALSAVLCSVISEWICD